MSRATPDDQLKFLLSCVRYSNNGKIDFVEVARECGVVSKGAAAKRYERLMKANGIHPNGGLVEVPSTPKNPRQKSKAEMDKAAAAKRRKIEGDEFDYKRDDEDEFKSVFKTEPVDMPHIKPEPGMSYSSDPFSYTSANHHLPLYPLSHPPRMHLQSSAPLPVQRWVPQRIPDVYRTAAYPPFSGEDPGPILTHPIMTQTAQPTGRNIITSAQQSNPAAPRKRSSPVVSEAQIQLMYEEFCSQDMCKAPKYDWLSTKAIAPDMVPSIFSKAELEASNNTVDTSTSTAPDSKPESADNQDLIPVPEAIGADNAIKTNAGTSPPKPTGKDIKDSILIID